MSVFPYTSSFIKIAIKNLFNSCASLSSIFLSIIDYFNVFPFNKLFIFIQCLNLVYGIVTFETYSWVISIATDVIRAELLTLGMMMRELTIDSIEDATVQTDSIKFSVIFRQTSLYLSFYTSFCSFKNQSQDFSEFSHIDVFSVNFNSLISSFLVCYSTKFGVHFSNLDKTLNFKWKTLFY